MIVGTKFQLKLTILIFLDQICPKKVFPVTNFTTHLKLKPTDPKANLQSIINTFQNHESVQRIKLANFHSKSSLTFNSVSEPDVKKEILNLSSKKATRKGDIPAKILKSSINAYLSEP